MRKIAIDCRPLMGHRAGIGRYLFELLREFARRDDDVRYFLYAPGPIEIPEGCINDPRFTVRVYRIRPAILWLHALVPFWLLHDRIDVFWGPNYAVPLIRLRSYLDVVTIHDATFARFPETMYWITRLHNKWMIPVYSRIAKRIITDSSFSRDELLQILTIPSDKIIAIHLGAQASEQSLTLPFGVEPKPYILSVCTVEPRKNLKSLIKAYANLSRDIRNQYDLVLAGAIGWGDVNPQEWIMQNGVVGSVHYLGKVDENVLQALYQNAEVFVFPSFYEGFGLPVLEAMKNGCPVVCSYNTSLGEITGNSALYIDPHNENDITMKLGAILGDVELRQEFGRRSRVHAHKYSWAKAADLTLRYLTGG